jgi:hypothetical protein
VAVQRPHPTPALHVLTQRVTDLFDTQIGRREHSGSQGVPEAVTAATMRARGHCMSLEDHVRQWGVKLEAGLVRQEAKRG